MTDADILLEDIINGYEYDIDNISVLSVLCEVVTNSKLTDEEVEKNEG